jgi:hypothetical protein
VWAGDGAPSDRAQDFRACSRVLVAGEAAAWDFVLAEGELPVGRTAHVVRRVWDAEAEALVRLPERLHFRVTSRSLDFQGLSGVWRTELQDETGFRVEHVLPEPAARRKHVWDEASGIWRIVESWPVPAPRDGRRFQVQRFRPDGPGALEHVAHYQWTAIEEFLCPYDGNRYRDVFAEVLVGVETVRANGALRRTPLAHGRVVRYFVKGRGFFYGFVEDAPGTAGALAAPQANGLMSDWFLRLE